MLQVRTTGIEGEKEEEGRRRKRKKKKKNIDQDTTASFRVPPNHASIILLSLSCCSL
jgi:hypothetical protein